MNNFLPKKFIKSYIEKRVAAEVDEKLSKELEKLNFTSIEQIRENDVIIAGYPKSGNTWMQSIISGIVYGIDTKYLPDRLANEIVNDVHAKSYYKRIHKVCFFKSHNLPQKQYKNVIYIVRDGRDAVVSYYHMNKKLGLEYSLRDMIVDGVGLFPSKWNKHVDEWLKNPYQSNIIYIRYEDLIYDFKKEIQKVCSFLEIQREESLIDLVMKGCSFEEMQAKEKKFGMENKNWNPKEQFFRKGIIGDYENELTQNLKSSFEQEAYDQLKAFNYL